MLNRKIIAGVAATALVSLALISCGGTKTVSTKDLPASGATKFITSDEDLYEFAADIEKYVYYGDAGLEALENALEEMESESIKPNLFNIFEEEEKKLEDFVESMADEDSSFAKTGKASYSINRKIGTVKGLPACLYIDVPTSKISASLNVDKKGNANVNGDFDVSATMSYDATKADLNEDELLLFKGFSYSASAKGNISANLIADEDFVEDEADYIDFVDYIEDLVLTAKADASFNFGASIVSPSGIGGKVIATVTANINEKIDSEKAEELADIFYSLAYRPDFEALEKFPVKLTASVKFYDDKGKETYTLLDAKSVNEIIETLSGFVM